MTVVLALRHLQAGDLARAERVCKKALKREPRNPQAMYLMGVIVHHRGRPTEALNLLEKAAQRQPDNPDCQYNLAECHRALAEAKSAIAGYRRAWSGAPDHAMAFVGIGETQLVQGQPSEAEDRFREALAKRTALLPALDGLARALRAQDRLAEAVEVWHRAIALDATKSELYSNLGLALRGLGRVHEAAAALALSLEPRLSHATIRRDFAACLKNRPVMAATPALRRLLEACFDAGDVDGQGLVAPVLSLFEADAGIVAEGDDDALNDASRDALWNDPLFVHLLTSTFIAKPAWERFVTRQRAIFLAAAETAPDELLFALATQCFNNEFVFAATDAEQDTAAALCRDVEARLAGAVEPGRNLERDLGHLGLYLPLHALAGAERLLEPPASRWSAPFRALLARQLAEPLEERETRATIPSISPERSAACGAGRGARDVRGEPLSEPDHRGGTPAAGRGRRAARHLPAHRGAGGVAPAARHIGRRLRHRPAGDRRRDAFQGLPCARRRPKPREPGLREPRESGLRKPREAGCRQHRVSPGQPARPDAARRRLSLDRMHQRAAPFSHHGRGARGPAGAARPAGAGGPDEDRPLQRDGARSCRRRPCLRRRARLSGDARRHPALPPGHFRPARRPDRAQAVGKPGFLQHQLVPRPDLPRARTALHPAAHRRHAGRARPALVGFELDKPEALNAYRVAYPDDAWMSDLGHWHAFEQANPETFLGMYQFWCQTT